MRGTLGPTSRSVMMFLAALASLPGSVEGQDSPGFADTRSRLVRLHVDRIAASWQESHGVPGLVVALVKGRRPLLISGYGVADLASGVPMDPERSIVHAAPLAGPLTAAALLQLVDAGLLDLNSDVDSYLQGMRVPPSFPEPVTARHLLDHTAGFDSRVVGRQVRRPEEILPLKDYLAARMPPRIRPPGLVSIYSEHGYALAGLLIAEVSGAPFTSYMQRNIFSPLKMRRSSFDWSPELESSVATGYDLVGTGLGPAPRELHQTVPASMLATTASDTALWMLALLNQGILEGHRILSHESASLMLSRQFTHHPAIAGRSFGFREGTRSESGELFQIGTSSGFSSAVVLLPDKRLGLFVAANCRVSIWDLIDGILLPFVGRDPGPGPQESPPQPDSSPEVAGYYRETGISLTGIEKLATLIRQDRVVEAAENGLVWRSLEFRPAEESLLFREVLTGAPLALVMSDSRTRFIASSWGLFERVSWFESRPLQLILWILFAAVFMAASAWPTSRFPRHLPELTPADSFRPRWPLYCASVAALFHLTFLITLAATLAWALGEGARSLAFGVPFAVRIVLCLPLIGAALTVPALLGVALAWRQGSWTFGYRLRWTLTLAVLSLFPPFLFAWNLFGFHF